ncbi:MAG: patatin-like phospholipase family protein [Pseudomonadota bacterium]
MKKQKINLALQGGGAHGSFTWGVLDRLLEEPEIEIAAITGTSAGALNGAAVKSGLVQGGPEMAREKLDWLWGQVGAVDNEYFEKWIEPFVPSMISKSIEYSLPYMVTDMTSRFTSPYLYGPLFQNPLTSIVDNFSYEAVCAETGPALFICATNVRTGKIRVFRGEEITTDAILASACLPTLFQAVEIRDPKTRRVEAYWDGGYTGNPALFPLFEPQFPEDLVIININPLVREELPHTPQEIQNRINEISFNSSLLRELRAIAFVKRLIAEDRMPADTMKNINVHMIADDDLMTELSVATKTTPSPIILSKLKSAGRAAAEKFLRDDADKLGKTSSIDISEMFN